MRATSEGRGQLFCRRVRWWQGEKPQRRSPQRWQRPSERTGSQRHRESQALRCRQRTEAEMRRDGDTEKWESQRELFFPVGFHCGDWGPGRCSEGLSQVGVNQWTLAGQAQSMCGHTPKVSWKVPVSTFWSMRVGW